MLQVQEATFHTSGGLAIVIMRNFFPLGLAAFVVALILFVLSDFGKQSPLSFLGKAEVPPGAEGIDLENAVDFEQGITTDIQPVDAIFADFEGNWRQFISPREELTLDVVTEDPEVPWKPLVYSECVFSEGAGANVPLMTLTWVEPAPITDKTPVRFDLTPHYLGFERESYSTIFPVVAQQRFNLPMNSALASDPEAVLLTGPGIFPKLVDFNQVVLTGRGGPVTAAPALDTTGPTPPGVSTDDAAAARAGVQYTIKLQDLNPGLAYKFRKCDLVESAWRSDQTVTFSTPVCTQKF